MMQPNLVRPAAARAQITLQSVLASTLREWFLYRDQALWAFVGGTEPARALEPIVIDENTAARIADANHALERAENIARQIATESGQSAERVLREALDGLLAAETPVFLLRCEHIPGSF